MTRPAVDIVTPSYNQSAFIRDTIESVKNQRYSNCTHHIIDGGSDDETVDILQEYPNLDWISEDDRGQTHAINKGFDRVEGDIVGWLNSDDPLVYRDTINTVVDVFEQTGADIFVGHAITISPNNELLRAHYIPEYNRDRMERLCYLMQPSVFFRSHVVEKHRLDEERDFSMDYEYWLRLGDQEYKWVNTNRVLSADRNHPNRKIIAQSDRSREDSRRLREEYDIDTGFEFQLGRLYERLDLRFRRLRGIPQLLRLLKTDESELAFDLERVSLLSSLRTQLLTKKLAL